MYFGKTLFSPVMEFVPWTSLARILQRHGGGSGVRALPCTEHFRAMAFAQITWRESQRDIEASPSANAGKLYATESGLGVGLDITAYALDFSTIDLCLCLFAWAPSRSTKAAIKLHTLPDLRGAIPAFIHISDGKLPFAIARPGVRRRSATRERST